MRRTLAIAGAVLALAITPIASHAADTVILAGPAARITDYFPPVVAATQGGSVTFINLDLSEHDVVAVDTRDPGSAPWCPPGGPRCPLFFTELTGLAQTAPVQGLEDVPPGTYAFRCTPHSGMAGQLVII